MERAINRMLSRNKRNVRYLNSDIPEFIVLFLFILFYIIITVYHEPWFDEAQAWQIGKCASLHDLLFVIPHYEGHPAFWSVLLAIPAKLGMPFEFSLKTIGLVISASSVYVILFKAKYPRFMRLTLPFTYFIFYQYGVIVRPYCIMILAFLLLSIYFPCRHEKPWSFTGLLMLLCLTGAYGIVMAGGIAICFLWEIISEKKIMHTISKLFIDQRTLSLLALLLLAVLLILEIVPYNNTLVTSANRTNSLLKCLLITFFTFIGESTITTGSWFSTDSTIVQFAITNTTELLVLSFLGIVLWIMLIGASSKKLLKYLMVPYILIAFFAAAVYFGVHHIGVIYLLLMFWFGILFQDNQRFEIGQYWIQKLSKTDRDKKLFHYSAFIIGLACLFLPVYWTIAASVHDIQEEYSYGRNFAKWIKDHDMECCKLMSGWGLGTSTATEDIIVSEENLLLNDVYIVGTPVVVNAYFDHNICMNLNDGRDDEAYMHYRIATWDEIKATKSRWREKGIPDLLTGRLNIQEIFGNYISLADYTVVYLLPMNRIWKNSNGTQKIPVYARNDILEQYNLEPLKIAGIDYWLNGITLTDEMIEQYEKGVPVEEILKPYLDSIFGE